MTILGSTSSCKRQRDPSHVCQYVHQLRIVIHDFAPTFQFWRQTENQEFVFVDNKPGKNLEFHSRIPKKVGLTTTALADKAEEMSPGGKLFPLQRFASPCAGLLTYRPGRKSLLRDCWSLLLSV